MKRASVHNTMLIFVLLFSKLIGSQNVTKVTFQADGKVSPDSMLDAGYDPFPRLFQFTLCFRLFMLYAPSLTSIISYYGDSDNEFNFGYWKNGVFEFVCCQRKISFNLKKKLKLQEWMHVCFATDLKTHKYWIALNGEIEEGVLPVFGSAGEVYVESGGHMVLGQELDTLEGAFNMHQSISGELAQFQLFSEALDPDYLKMYSNCQSPVTNAKPLFSFQTELDGFQLKGSLAVSEIALETLCNQRKQTLYILPEKMNFYKAQKACTMVNANLATPKSKAENDAAYDDNIQFNDDCVDSYGVLYWLGINGDLETKKWLYVKDGSEIMWDNFDNDYREISSQRTCSSVGGKDFPYFWYSTPCEFLSCPLCNFSTDALFTVRGLCKKSIVDRSFSLYEYKNMKMQFLGPSYTRLYWDNVSKTWIIESQLEPDLKGMMQIKSQYDLPLGLKTWDFTGDKCASSTVEMLITICTSSEFTCNNGMCIRKDKRCDKTLDCPDNSDEIDCSLLIVPIGYKVELPPPGDNKGPLSIELFLGITSVREINIMGLKMLVDVVLEMRWRDTRVQMKNLNVETKMNKIHKYDFPSMWRPKLQVEDGSSSIADLVSRSMSIMVKREGDPLPEDLSRLHEDYIYLGSENTFYQRQVETIGFTCAFQLHSYPFDIQTCSLIFKLIDVTSDVAMLSQLDAGVDFVGKRRLLEYEVTMVNMTFVNSSDGRQGRKVTIELRNLYGYYISNTYVPTTLLVVIGYLTLFFDENDFTDRVMVSLTSLLVLGSLFTSTSHSIPKTAYLKLIDLWFVALIIIMFVIILILVIIENFRMKNMKQTSTKEVERNIAFVSSSGSSSGSSTAGRDGIDHARPSPTLISSRSLKKHVFVNSLAKILLPLFIIIFIIYYTILCL